MKLAPLVSIITLPALVAFTGCGSSPSPQAPTSDATPTANPTTASPSTPPPATDATAPATGATAPAAASDGAKEGETCGDGTFGRPNRSCASGLVCKYPESTAPKGPAGSSSALPGKCTKG